MAIIIPISTKTVENPVLAKLKAMDRIRCEKMIEDYKIKKAFAQTKAK
jgi:hypothetical protein